MALVQVLDGLITLQSEKVVDYLELYNVPGGQHKEDHEDQSVDHNADSVQH